MEKNESAVNSGSDAPYAIEAPSSESGLGQVKRTKSAFRHACTFLWNVVRRSRNPWYYWYTGSKYIAIQAWVFSFCTMLTMVAFASGGGLYKMVIYIFLGVALENLAILVILIALLADYYFPIPDMIYSELLLPVLVSACGAFIINRLSVAAVLYIRSRR